MIELIVYTLFPGVLYPLLTVSKTRPPLCVQQGGILGHDFLLIERRACHLKVAVSAAIGRVPWFTGDPTDPFSAKGGSLGSPFSMRLCERFAKDGNEARSVVGGRLREVGGRPKLAS